MIFWKEYILIFISNVLVRSLPAFLFSWYFIYPWDQIGDDKIIISYFVLSFIIAFLVGIEGGSDFWLKAGLCAFFAALFGETLMAWDLNRLSKNWWYTYGSLRESFCIF